MCNSSASCVYRRETPCFHYSRIQHSESTFFISFIHIQSVSQSIQARISPCSPSLARSLARSLSSLYFFLSFFLSLLSLLLPNEIFAADAHLYCNAADMIYAIFIFLFFFFFVRLFVEQWWFWCEMCSNGWCGYKCGLASLQLHM